MYPMLNLRLKNREDGNERGTGGASKKETGGDRTLFHSTMTNNQGSYWTNCLEN